MEVEPARRYATALDLADELDRVRAEQPTRARPQTAVGQCLRWIGRNRTLAAALLVTAVAAALAVLAWQAKQLTQEPARAFERYSDAVMEERRPDPRDLELLAGLIPELAVRESFLRNAADPAVYEKLQRRVIEETANRGPSDGGERRLLEPREAITDARPVFRFEVPDTGTDTWPLIFSVWSDDLPPLYTQVLEHSGSARELALKLPSGALHVGPRYAWSVRRTTEEDPDHPLYAPEPARFRIEPPSARDAIIGQTRQTGIATFDALLRASALLAGGFVRDAQAELDRVDRSASVHERRLAASLRAEAVLRMGDRMTFEALRQQALEMGR
jgi:hypothetical protein